MADAFGELGQLVEEKETGTSVKDAKAQQDEINRKNALENLKNKMDELAGIQERLYQLRFEDRSKDDVLRDTKNLFQEYTRVEDEITAMREAQRRQFVLSLQLDQLGLTPAAIRTMSVLPPRSHTFAATGQLQPDLEDMKMMRTRSTQTLKDRTASDKWRGLFSMFREWRYQRNLAEANYVAQRDTKDILGEEKAKIRSAIYKLKHNKNLSESDANLLRVLTTKLKALNEMGEVTVAP